MLSRLIGSKAFLILLKFLQSLNLKKTTWIYTIYISDKFNFKKLILLLMKIVIIIFNIIINIIVIKNSNEKELFILGWFNEFNWTKFSLIQ
jgi:hypothetical protein